MKTASAMHKSITLSAALLLAAVAVFPAAAQAGPQTRAGVVGWVKPSMGVFVRFSTPMPDTKYAAVVQQTNTAGYSTTKDCTYFNVLHLTVNGFDVQHKRCDDGTPVPTDENITLEWIAVGHQ
jgi:hypothetical protein